MVDETSTDELKPKAVLTILIDPSGSVSVAGLIEDKVMAYGFLELAKEAISEHHRKRAESNIVKPRGIMDFVRNGKK